MEEWLRQIWERNKSLATRTGALILLIFIVVLGIVALFSDTGFADEVRVYRWWILTITMIVAVVSAGGIILWRTPRSRRFLIRLYLLTIRVIIWIRINWQPMLGLAILVPAIYGVYLLTHTLWAVVVTLSIVLAVTLLARSRPGPSSAKLGSRQIFHEDFSQPNLPNWKYSGEWRTETEEDGEKHFLIVTQSETGGIAKPCFGWEDYVFKFETKIVRHSTSWIIRAVSRGHYVMLQCQKDRLRPHFRQVDQWALPEKWTKPNMVRLPQILPLNHWFGVCIEVRGIQVVVTLTVQAEEIEVLNCPLLAPPVAPEDYPIGSVGFRESEYECAYFRNVHVEYI